MAWSRAERHIGLGVLVLVLTTAFTSHRAWRHWRMQRTVRGDFQVVDQAIRLYRQAYQRMPMPANTLIDLRYGQASDLPNASLFNVLRAKEEAVPEPARLNPDRKVFLELKPVARGESGINEAGEFLDPWGSPYQVILDGNGDRICELVEARFGSALGEWVAVWSYGPDRVPDSADDLISWQTGRP